MGLTLQHGHILVEPDLPAAGRDDVWLLGDCAHILMKEDASDRHDHAPPTAQFAVREVLYRAGGRVFEMGSRADGFYTMLSDELEATEEDNTTGDLTTHRVGP